jgi:hypothetical protein
MIGRASQDGKTARDKAEKNSHHGCVALLTAAARYDWAPAPPEPAAAAAAAPATTAQAGGPPGSSGGRLVDNRPAWLLADSAPLARVLGRIIPAPVGWERPAGWAARSVETPQELLTAFNGVRAGPGRSLRSLHSLRSQPGMHYARAWWPASPARRPGWR